jgi:hypothetical protein
MSKAVRSGFVSHARDGSALVERFLDIMGPRCSTRRDVEIELWTDRMIVAGQDWNGAIVAALGDADFGLLCVSPSFLASPFVTGVELPALMAAERIVIPLALEPLDLVGMDLKGLELLQIFHLRRPRTSQGLSFEEYRGVNAKRFCDELVAQIVQRLRANREVA